MTLPSIQVSRTGWLLAASVGAVWLLSRRERRAETREPGSALRRIPGKWWEKRRPTTNHACYQRKTDALLTFIDHNRAVIDNYGGESYRVGESEFDSINAKYETRGRKARTIAEAVDMAMPPGKAPYCLADIDLDALNDSSPAREAEEALGIGFELPPEVYEAQDYPEPSGEECFQVCACRSMNGRFRKCGDPPF